MQEFKEWLYENNMNQLGSKFSNLIPGNTKEDKLSNSLDMVNLALDGAGIVDPSGVSDGINSIIYAIRAFASKNADTRNKHLADSAISLISAIPFADLIKLLRFRKYKKTARAAVKVAQPISKTARSMRNDRFQTNQVNTASQLASQFVT